MDIWFSQMDTENVKTSIRVEKQLFSQTSDYQRIDVFGNPLWDGTGKNKDISIGKLR